ncbi:conserved exported hypothetical protein [Paraburkholderia unamae]|uniref:hypothetical protein n=1 Tax=Paraburkholderia unamae TaxID=219649 RepID=UPI000DC23767|nr:hypothetical protein [Paraburkholderia unamae]RAR66805.1 hypothetical protein C7401_102230 [Paraburkholderia unamae]CAG9273203.1 conserved exported hypothetical protein [Paraburkholderia unamae]
MKRILAILLCATAAACASHGQVNPDVMQIATAPLTCSNKTECDLWWKRAEDWVRSHSKYEVQTVTDTLIQTSGPGGGRRLLAYEITKAVSSDGTATIGFAAHCDSSLGCKPNPWSAGAAFKQFVRTGVDAPLPDDTTTGSGGDTAGVSGAAVAEPASSAH